MEQCDYCGAEFESEDAYLAHLADEHEGELSAIDRRRAASLSDDDGEFPTGPVVIVLVVAFALALVVYVTMFMGAGNSGVNGYDVAQTPNTGVAIHEHGLMNVTIDGQRVDFSQREYQVQNDYFHFENGNGRIWHTHAEGVTLEYALATLGIDVTSSTVSFQGETYRDGDAGTSVSVTVDGEPVDPSTYVLDGVQDTQQVERGDHVRVVVTTDG